LLACFGNVPVWALSAGLICARIKGVKFDVHKIHRSNIYHLLNTIIPINHKLKAESDALGIVIILGLILGLVSLVRFILNCTH